MITDTIRYLKITAKLSHYDAEQPTASRTIECALATQRAAEKTGAQCVVSTVTAVVCRPDCAHHRREGTS
jgi:hypothetical protein